MNQLQKDLEEKIGTGEARVGVIGLGYVGLPLALAFADSGLTVLGFDTDSAKVESLGRGESYIAYIDPERLAAAVREGRLAATTDMARLGEPDATLICVPTPLDPKGEPDLRYVLSTGAELARSLRDGQLIVLESTTYPGTTDEVLRPILEATGRLAGRQFFLAFSPEREDPGNKTFDLHSIPKVVGADDAASAAVATALYRRVVGSVIPVSGTRVAEASKLTENVYRAVNIALVNELKVIYDAMGIDVWEVLDAAATKPFGFHRFDPGPGWGGHCIPIDPFFLSWKAAQSGSEARFIELAGRINIEMPRWVVDKLEAALEDRGQKLAGSRVLILGLAYKKDVADPRESPSFELIAELLRRGATPSYHDPHIATLPPMRSWPDIEPMDSIELSEQALTEVDAVVIATNHTDVDYELVARCAPLIVDPRGVFDAGRPRVIKA